MIKLKDDFEVNVWVNIYSKNAGNDDIYHDGDPAAETADKAIRSLRMRMPGANASNATDTSEKEAYLNSSK